MSDNVWYDPEAFGLSVVGSADEPGLSYEFNTFAVWRRNEDGALFCASSIGCSCPTPFEEYESVDNLTACQNVEAVRREAEEWAADDAGRLIEVNKLMRHVREVVSEP